MKIGFVLDDSLDSSDGVQQYILTLGKWLKDQGSEVHYLVGNTKRTDIENVHSFSKKVSVRFNKNRMTVPLPSSLKKIRSLLLQLDLDVLHVQMPYSPMFAARVIDMAPESVAVVGTFHIAPFSWLEKSATKALGLYLKPNIRHFDEFISVSKEAKRFAKKSFKIDSVVIPNAVDVASFYKKTTDSEVINRRDIVFVGRLVPRKGCQHLIKSFIMLLENRPDLIGTKLHICGDGKERPKLVRLASSSKFASSIIFHGFVSEQKKKQVLNSARIAAFPSTGGESFGIVLIESMAAGAGVVIGGDNAGYRTVLGDGTPLFSPSYESDLAELLEYYFSDGNLLRENKRQSKIVKKFDIELVGPEIFDIYKSAIAKHNRFEHNIKQTNHGE